MTLIYFRTDHRLYNLMLGSYTHLVKMSHMRSKRVFLLGHCRNCNAGNFAAEFCVVCTSRRPCPAATVASMTRPSYRQRAVYATHAGLKVSGHFNGVRSAAPSNRLTSPFTMQRQTLK